MRDIRPDLEERLNIVVNEINAATAKLALLHVQRDQLKKMLEAEGKRFLASPTSQSITQTLDALSGAISGTVLTLVIKEGLADGKPYTLGELAEFVAKSGYQFGTRSPRRVTNFALLSLKKANQVIRVKMPDGNRGWQLKK